MPGQPGRMCFGVLLSVHVGGKILRLVRLGLITATAISVIAVAAVFDPLPRTQLTDL